MLLRCAKSFETREGGIARTVDKGDVFYIHRHVHVAGGYEVAVLERVEGGVFTGDVARVRVERLTEDFDVIPLKETTVYLRQ